MKYTAKPFIKWAGGKSALLDDIRRYYPEKLGKSINKYCEPFIGGGAVLFDVLSNYKIEHVYISDRNEQLINLYKAVQNNVEELIEHLRMMQAGYIALDVYKRKDYYYERRDLYNQYIQKMNIDSVYGSALFMFLNRTCFNGLYRVNGQGLFNVPSGAYKNPRICDEEGLLEASRLLKGVSIEWAGYEESYDFIDSNTFVYFDPPYRPLTESANFTSYSKDKFDDEDQIKLGRYFEKLAEKDAKLLLSNSDPKNINESDDFFDDLYKGFDVLRIKSKRRINSDASKRGEITEILVTNVKGD